MKIDPSQLSEPLAHVLGVGKTDAAAGQKAAAARGADLSDPQLEQLDAALLERMRMGSLLDAQSGATSVEEARGIMARLAELLAGDGGDAGAAQGGLDAARVRGLLDG